jgi:hypothetical protein
MKWIDIPEAMEWREDFADRGLCLIVWDSPSTYTHTWVEDIQMAG